MDKKFKAVFFDLGGTLRISEDDEKWQGDAWKEMRRLAGWDPDDLEGFKQMITDRYAVYREWALRVDKESSDFELWHKWLMPELPEEKVQEICHEITYQYRQAAGKRHVVEGGPEVIKGLYERGYKLGIISNLIGEQEIPNWLKADGLDKYFSSVVLSPVCGLRKPDPEIYLIACRELGVKPEECVSIADNIGRDMKGGRKAGIGANVLVISPDKLMTKTITPEIMPDRIVCGPFIKLLDLDILQ